MAVYALREGETRVQFSALRFGPVVQSVEHSIRIREVGGAIPPRSTFWKIVGYLLIFLCF